MLSRLGRLFPPHCTAPLMFLPQGSSYSFHPIQDNVGRMNNFSGESSLTAFEVSYLLHDLARIYLSPMVQRLKRI